MGFAAVKAASTNLRALEARLSALETARNAQAALSLADVILASEEGVSAEHPRAAAVARAAAKVRATPSDPLAREICRLAGDSAQVADSASEIPGQKKREPALSAAAVVRPACNAAKPTVVTIAATTPIVIAVRRAIRSTASS